MSAIEEEAAPRCANHPTVETLVSCSNCGKPICPDCMVHAPVGVKCRDCARMPRSALVRLKPRAGGHGHRRLRGGAAVAIGIALAALTGSSFGFFGLLISFGVGIVMAEIVTRSSGYYRGRESGLIAAGASILAYVSRGWPCRSSTRTRVWRRTRSRCSACSGPWPPWSPTAGCRERPALAAAPRGPRSSRARWSAGRSSCSIAAAARAVGRHGARGSDPLAPFADAPCYREGSSKG